MTYRRIELKTDVEGKARRERIPRGKQKFRIITFLKVKSDENRNECKSKKRNR